MTTQSRNRPDRNRFTRWLNQRDGLSDDPLRRAAQIALSAIAEIDFSDLGDDTGMIVAYEALSAALSESAMRDYQEQADGELDTSHIPTNGYRYRDYTGQGDK